MAKRKNEVTANEVTQSEVTPSAKKLDNELVTQTLKNIVDGIKPSINPNKGDFFAARKPILSIVAICPDENESSEFYRFIDWLPVHEDVEVILCRNTQGEKESFVIDRKEGTLISALHTVPEFEFDHCRNVAKSIARGEWILSLDLDERILTPIDELLGTLKNIPIQVDGVRNILISADTIKQQPIYDVHAINAIRIFRNRDYIKFEGRVHELVSGTLAHAMQTDIVIHHYGYIASDDVFYQKLKRNFDLLVKELTSPRTQATYNNAYENMLKTASLLRKYKVV